MAKKKTLKVDGGVPKPDLTHIMNSKYEPKKFAVPFRRGNTDALSIPSKGLLKGNENETIPLCAEGINQLSVERESHKTKKQGAN